MAGLRINRASPEVFSFNPTIQILLTSRDKKDIPQNENLKTCFDLYACRVDAGFPSPADDHIERSLDLNEYLIHHPVATFFVRVNGDSMINVGIHHQDILVVDRSLEPKDGSIIIAVLNGELTVKTLEYRNKCPFLVPANPAYQPIQIIPEMAFSIWGVVTSVIHQFTR